MPGRPQLAYMNIPLTEREDQLIKLLKNPMSSRTRRAAWDNGINQELIHELEVSIRGKMKGNFEISDRTFADLFKLTPIEYRQRKNWAWDKTVYPKKDKPAKMLLWPDDQLDNYLASHFLKTKGWRPKICQ